MSLPIIGNQIDLYENGEQFRTLRDLLPENGKLRVLIVAKTPAPVSVAAGHYFQGRQGRMFWNALKSNDLLSWKSQGKEDDDLIPNGWGLTDIVKRPRDYSDEPSPAEYREGAIRIKEIIDRHQPRAVLFVYKRVLDQLLSCAYGVERKSEYGQNTWADQYLGARVFAFPMPGTPCTKPQAIVAMADLVAALNAD